MTQAREHHLPDMPPVVIQPQDLSLRDFFAAAALTGIISPANSATATDSQVASFCYSIADAMLAESAK